MANLYLTLDKRSIKKDGSLPLKLALSHQRSTAYASLEVSLKPEEWDEPKIQVVKRPDKKFLNVEIRKRLSDATTALGRIEQRADFDELSAARVLKMIMRGTDTLDDEEALDYVLPVYNEYIATCRKASTASIYRASLKNLLAYEKNIDSFTFKDMNVAWLRKYQNWLTDPVNGNGMSVNGMNVYFRNLRTVFNFALQNEYTHARYPFKAVDMSTTKPDKRAIPYDKFIEWVTKPMTDGRVMYRDLFMLSFYLCGIRPIDLLNVKKSQVEDGRLVYRPEKLNGRTELSIKIEPEAWEIIRKYEGDEYLINIMDARTDYKAFCQHWNKGLRAIGTDTTLEKECGNGKVYRIVKHHGIVPYITVYYARTCWATYAYNILDMPMDIISQALGHSSGLKVTNFYVKRDEAKVDKANRDMIDRITADIKKATA